MSETHGNPSDHHHGPPALPEPKTPLWLPAVGVVLFFLAGLFWALSPANGGAGTSGAAGSATTGTTAAPTR